MKLPPHIQAAARLIQLYDAEKAQKITETGKAELDRLRAELPAMFSNIPIRVIDYTADQHFTNDTTNPTE